MNLKQIPRVATISKSDFKKNYLKPQQPVIIEGLTNDWLAYKKWNLDYIKKIAGTKTVPLYDNRPVDYRDAFNEPHKTMKMSDYISLLKREPTNYRIFLWNILKEVPQLQNDFSYPNLGLRLLKSVPMLFFGGANSYTFMHYDIDLANIFHFHFEGKKEVILFDQSQSKYLYKVPHSLITREDIDFSNPDLSKWPALQYAKGYIGQLNHGDVLYMPEGYWHYMKYITPGFSMSLRALPRHPLHILKAIYNLTIMRPLDSAMRKCNGENWINWKNKQAILRTTR